MYKKMDIGERAAKIAELARQLGILEGLVAGRHAVAGAGGPTTADAALFPTLVFCKEARRLGLAQISKTGTIKSSRSHAVSMIACCTSVEVLSCGLGLSLARSCKDGMPDQRGFISAKGPCGCADQIVGSACQVQSLRPSAGAQ